MSGVEGADSIGGVYIGATWPVAAGSVGNSGPGDVGDIGGAVAPATGRVGGGMIGVAGGLADGGIVVPVAASESSNTDRRAVTYGPELVSRGVTGPGAAGGSGAGRSPRRGSGSSGVAADSGGGATG